MFHQWVALVFFSLFALAGLVLTVAGLGGTFLVLAGALIYNMIIWKMAISGTALLWLLGLAIAGELLEWLITLMGLKAGMSKYGLIGTILGAVAGAALLSFIPILGTIIGLILGAYFGALLAEFYHTRNWKKSFEAAKTAFWGRTLVSLSKFVIAIIQIAIVVKEVF